GGSSGKLGHYLSLDLANAGGDQPAACPRLRRRGVGLVRRTRDLYHRGRLHYGADRGHQHFCAEERPLAAGPPPHHSPAGTSPNRRQSNRAVSRTPRCQARSSVPMHSLPTGADVRHLAPWCPAPWCPPYTTYVSLPKSAIHT